MSHHPTVHDHVYRFVIVVCIALAAGWLVYHYVSEQRQALLEQVAEQIAHTESTLRDMTVSSGTTATAIPQCNSATQEEFERLLGRLGTGLASTELQYLAIEFDRCAGVFAQEQYRYSQTLAVYVDMLAQFASLEADLVRHESVTGTAIPLWRDLVTAETALAGAQIRLVEAQRELVLLRLAGEAVAGDSIVAILDEVQTEIRPAIQAAREDRQNYLNKLEL